MTAKPIVSAIIVNWNGAEHLRVCLPSLMAQSCQPLEIIVADNGSTDESEQVADEFGVRWLSLGGNLGLAPALNRGAAVASGDFLLFLNNDMRFDPEFVSALIDPLLQDERIFASDGTQFNWDGTSKGHAATRLTNLRAENSGAVQMVPGLWFHRQLSEEFTRVFMASAASMLVRKSLFDALDGFDERLILGYEDVEICWRAWMRGWPSVYVPGAICWHRVGSSCQTPEGSRFSFRGVLKGRLLLAMKVLPFRYVFRTWIISTAGLGKDLARLRGNSAADRIRILAKCFSWIPALLRERKRLFREARTTPKAMLEHLLQLTEQKKHVAPLQSLKVKSVAK